jgi:2-phospho-L-lactate guanylyltransferase
VPWTAIVPVKRLALAKTRLHAPGIAREDLALSFALDTCSALLAAVTIDAVVVITDDDRAREAFDTVADPRLTVISDVPNAGLNAALVHGAASARAASATTSVVAVSADLPALTATDVDAVLQAASDIDGLWFVADISGVGTTMLGAPTGVALTPSFGHRSRAAHRSLGAHELAVGARSARRDVDTAVDLWDAERLGLGPSTTTLLSNAVSPSLKDA